MYARVTTVHFDPARLAEVKTKLAEAKPMSKSMTGVIDTYAVWRADGLGVITAIFDNKANAEAAATKAQSVWAGLAGLLKGAPKIEAFDHVEHLAG